MRRDSDQAHSSGSSVWRWRPNGRAMVVIAIVVLVLATHGRILNPVIRGLGLAIELLGLSDEHQQLQAENEALAQSTEYLKTTEGRELLARSELGAVEPDERLIIIRKDETSSSIASPSLSQRLRSWLARNKQAMGRVTHEVVGGVKWWLGLSDAAGTSAAHPDRGADSPS